MRFLDEIFQIGDIRSIIFNLEMWIKMLNNLRLIESQSIHLCEKIQLTCFMP